MACILKPEFNFMHGYFRCLLPEETVDVKLKVKMMGEASIHLGESEPPRSYHANHGVPDSFPTHLL